MEGNLRFKIDWASLINGTKFTVFSLFYFVFEGNFRAQAPWEALIWKVNGKLTFRKFQPKIEEYVLS